MQLRGKAFCEWRYIYSISASRFRREYSASLSGNDWRCMQSDYCFHREGMRFIARRSVSLEAHVHILLHRMHLHLIRRHTKVYPPQKYICSFCHKSLENISTQNCFESM